MREKDPLDAASDRPHQQASTDAKFLPAVKTLVSDAKKDDEHQVAEEGAKGLLKLN